MSLTSFSFLITLATYSSMMVNKNDDKGMLVWLLTLGRSIQSLTIRGEVNSRCSIDDIYQDEKIPFFLCNAVGLHQMLVLN
jgi:hypothetical protein